MSYCPLQPPPGLSETERIVFGPLNRLLHDVHTMLKLPRVEAGLDAGCNISATIVLLAVGAGVSERLAKTGKRNKEKKFVECLRRHYPWEAEGITNNTEKQRIAGLLWKLFRNPLAHTLGFPQSEKSWRIDGQKIEVGGREVSKSALDDARLEVLERAEDRPSLLETKQTLREAGGEYILHVPALYWGVRRMAMAAAESALAEVQPPQAPIEARSAEATRTRVDFRSEIGSSSGNGKT